MNTFTILIWGVLALVQRTLRNHFQVVNEGSPAPDQACTIDDVTLAQAFYAQLEAGGADYYRFNTAPDTPLRLSMLVPQHLYQAGFQPLVVVQGAGLPADGLVLPAGDMGTRQGTTLYQRTQHATPTLAGGSYLVQVQSEQAGVYCLCVGTRETGQRADAATVARVRAMLER